MSHTYSINNWIIATMCFTLQGENCSMTTQWQWFPWFFSRFVCKEPAHFHIHEQSLWAFLNGSSVICWMTEKLRLEIGSGRRWRVKRLSWTFEKHFNYHIPYLKYYGRDSIQTVITYICSAKELECIIKNLF